MKIQKDSHGVFNPLLVVLLVVVIAVIGFAVTKVSSNKSGSKSSSSPSSSQSSSNAISDAACLKSVNDSNLCKFASKYDPKASYVATDKSTSSDGTSDMTIKADSKNNSSITLKQNGVVTAEYVTLNNATYVKDETTGVWTKYAASSSTPTTTDPASDIKFSNADITDGNTLSYKAVGKETCGNTNCYKYQVIDSSNPSNEQFLWFGTSDYQMHRWSLKDSNGTNDMTFNYQSVNITAPSPVQDFQTQ